MRRWRPALLVAVLACLLAGACTRDNSDTDRSQHNGFYGGISGGMNAP